MNELEEKIAHKLAESIGCFNTCCTKYDCNWCVFVAKQIIPIVEADLKERHELKFNPDYLDFDKGVLAGRALEKSNIIEKLKAVENDYKDKSEGRTSYYHKSPEAMVFDEAVQACIDTISQQEVKDE